AAIETALSKDDTGPAIELYRQSAGKLSSADAASLASQIATAEERETGWAYVSKLSLYVPDRGPVLDVGQRLADLDATHAAATAQNAVDWADHPDQRATNQHFIDVQVGKAKRAVVQAKAKLDQAVAEWLARPGADGRPQTERPPAAIWTKVTSDERKKLDVV